MKRSKRGDGISSQGTRVGNNPSTVADLNVGTFGIHSKGIIVCARGPAAVSYANRAFDFEGWGWIQLNTAYDVVFATFGGGEAIRLVQAGGVIVTGTLATTEVSATPTGTAQTVNLGREIIKPFP